MGGKSTKELKLRGLPAVVAVVIGSLTLVVVWLLAERSLLQPLASSRDSALGSQTQPLTVPKLPNVTPSPALDSVLAQETATPQSASASDRQGTLRVGNSTEHPVRIALLLKKLGRSKTAAASSGNYEPPAHWDFEPGEGSTKGLVLSLPKRTLKLKAGDILVAFAQDGTRRYWGPYVVGDSTSPVWDAATAEWQMVLQP